MKSLTSKAKNILEKRQERMNKRGVFGAAEAGKFFGIILGVGLLVFIIIVIMGTVNDANILTAGTTYANEATSVLQNVSSAGSQFAGQLPTVGLILGVLVLILVLLVLARSAKDNTTGAI